MSSNQNQSHSNSFLNQMLIHFCYDKLLSGHIMNSNQGVTICSFSFNKITVNLNRICSDTSVNKAF